MSILPSGPNGLGVFAYAPTASAWNSGTTYAANDTASYGGIDWFSLVSGNVGVTPGSDDTKWQVSTLSFINVNDQALSAAIAGGTQYELQVPDGSGGVTGSGLVTNPTYNAVYPVGTGSGYYGQRSFATSGNTAAGYGCVSAGYGNNTGSASYGVCIGGYNQGTGSVYAPVAIGFGNTVTSGFGIGIGTDNTVSGDNGIGIGTYCQVSGQGAVGLSNATATAPYSVGIGRATASLMGQLAVGAVATGQQSSQTPLIASTNSTSPVEMTGDGSTPASGNTFTVPSGATKGCLVLVTGSKSGGGGAVFLMLVLVQNVSGTITVIGSFTIASVNPSTYPTPTLTVDATYGALSINVADPVAFSTSTSWVANVISAEIV